MFYRLLFATILMCVFACNPAHSKLLTEHIRLVDSLKSVPNISSKVTLQTYVEYYKTNMRWAEVGKTYNHIGMLQQMNDKYDSAAVSFNLAKEYAKIANDTNIVVVSSQNLTTVYSRMMLYFKAIKTTYDLLPFLTEHEACLEMNNIASIFLAVNSTDSASAILNRIDVNNINIHKSNIYSNKATLSLQKADTNNAIFLYRKAIMYAKNKYDSLFNQYNLLLAGIGDKDIEVLKEECIENNFIDIYNWIQLYQANTSDKVMLLTNTEDIQQKYNALMKLKSICIRDNDFAGYIQVDSLLDVLNYDVYSRSIVLYDDLSKQISNAKMEIADLKSERLITYIILSSIVVILIIAAGSFYVISHKSKIIKTESKYSDIITTKYQELFSTAYKANQSLLNLKTKVIEGYDIEDELNTVSSDLSSHFEIQER